MSDEIKEDTGGIIVHGAPPETPNPGTWDQQAYRRLSNGDYWLLQHERYGDRVRISLGRPDPADPENKFTPEYDMVLTVADLNWMIHDLSYLTSHVHSHRDAIFQQMKERLDQAHGQVDELQRLVPLGNKADQANIFVRAVDQKA